MTTYEQRQSKGKILCEKLTEAVAQIAPEGIGRWDRAWEIVDESSATFMNALSTWEVDPSDVAMQRVSDAYDGVLDGWRRAAAAFVAERSEA